MEIKTIHNGKSLGESVDILRDCVNDLAEDVQELYELDDDNYKKIQGLIDGLQTVKAQINGLQRYEHRTRRRMVLGLLGIGGLLYFGSKAIDEYLKRTNERLDKLERENQKNGSEEPEKAEESDG